jgi:hypothetical protein
MIVIEHFIEINGIREPLDLIEVVAIDNLQDDLMDFIKKHPGGQLSMIHPITVRRRL